MKINTALIMCAGYGTRLLPITNDKPKPLIQIKGKTLLSKAIDLIFLIGIKQIKINSFYLSEQLNDFVRNTKFQKNIEIINDGEELLNTGGGVKNMLNNFNDDDFLVLNPDTIWNYEYKETIIKMIDHYYNNKLNNLLLVVNKKYSFDKRLNGDFEFKNFKLTKENKKNHIYTGLQILNKKLFINEKEKIFSMNKIWNKQIELSNLNGFESNQKFLHLTDLDIYKAILKNN